jgi:hypothetical protein
VEFPGRDWNSARVIGFESNPVQCIPWPSGMFLPLSNWFGGGVVGTPRTSFGLLRAVRSVLSDPCSCFPTLRYDGDRMTFYREGGSWVQQYVMRRNNLSRPNIYYDTVSQTRFDLDIPDDAVISVRDEEQRSGDAAFGRSGDGRFRNIVLNAPAEGLSIQETFVPEAVSATYNRFVTTLEIDCLPEGDAETAYIAGWLTEIDTGGCAQPYPPLPAQSTTNVEFIPASEHEAILLRLNEEFSMPEFIFLKDSVTGQARRYRYDILDIRNSRWGVVYEDDPI